MDDLDRAITELVKFKFMVVNILTDTQLDHKFCGETVRAGIGSVELAIAALRRMKAEKGVDRGIHD